MQEACCMENFQTKELQMPKPFASWLLNANAQWEAPVAMPTDGKMYSWDEDTVSWKEFLG